MSRNIVFESIRKTAIDILPKGSSLFLYGSRARGDYKSDSDWDILILLEKNSIDNRDYDLLYEFNKLGALLNEVFIPIVYTKEQWKQKQGSDFYENVEHDKLVLL